ncbi:hypothetical protein AWZ03_010552 [Drosophila navojoa]|uniref:LITAF domain-containing protein n=1 Tax=Drosophila navojoa TaxID=7232 RepID=A0A484B4M1_DRONA|nr:uncharacterized protein LOC108653710 [Drosophila navojoa]TDG43030.1 hypothetical protein AWZ03_010552 [Drosophila navojoa]
MTAVEPQVVAISIGNLKAPVGYLQTEPTMVNCPACEHFAMSIVAHETVSYLQRILSLTKLCRKWSGRHDCNHYCAHCGCFIGRYVPIGCYERCLSRSARQKAIVDEMHLKVKPRDCAVRAQKLRSQILAKRAEKRAKAEAQQANQTVLPNQ